MPLGLGQSSVFSLMLPRQFDLEPVNVSTLSPGLALYVLVCDEKERIDMTDVLPTHMN